MDSPRRGGAIPGGLGRSSAILRARDDWIFRVQVLDWTEIYGPDERWMCVKVRLLVVRPLRSPGLVLAAGASQILAQGWLNTNKERVVVPAPVQTCNGRSWKADDGVSGIFFATGDPKGLHRTFRDSFESIEV